MRTWWCTSTTTPSHCDATMLGTSSTRYPAGRPSKGSHWVSVSQIGRMQGPPGSTPAAAPTSQSCS